MSAKIDPAAARREAEEALAFFNEHSIYAPPATAAVVRALRALLAEPAPVAQVGEVMEAAEAFRLLLSEPSDLESPASLVATGMWEKGDSEAPFWSEAGLYGRVGREAARTLLARHRRATVALAALDAAKGGKP